MTPRRLTFLVAALDVVLGGAGLGAAIALRGVAGTTPSTALAAPHFVDDTGGSGVQHVYSTLEDIGVGGGVAAFDCDGDGKPDLYVAGGSQPATLLHNDSAIGGPLRFRPVGDAVTDVRDVTGAYPIDIDGDGIVDLAVLRIGGVELLRGLGGCRFEPADARWSFDGGSGWATAFSATWEGSNRLPTIAVGNYLRLDAKGPATYACDDDWLVRPASDGLAFGKPLRLAPGYCALSMLFSDWNRSGRRDLRISNDRHYYDFENGGEQLWRISPGLPPRAYTAADGWVQLQIYGMGIASMDLTGDGYPEVFLTNQGPNHLQTLAVGPSAPTYRDVGRRLGAEAGFPYAGDTSLPSTAWHPEFEDVNNDGFTDLFISKGSIGDQADYAIQDPSDLLIGQPDGRFVEGAGAAGLLEFDPGRGAALADFNLDGLLDLVEVKIGAPLRLWRNVGAGDASAPKPMGGWLALRPQQPGADRDAIGGWIEVKVGDTTLRRELTIGGGHAGGQLGWVHFGLGSSPSAEVRVIWPDGTSGPWQQVRANTFAILERGASAPVLWRPSGG